MRKVTQFIVILLSLALSIFLWHTHADLQGGNFPCPTCQAWVTLITLQIGLNILFHAISFPLWMPHCPIFRVNMTVHGIRGPPEMGLISLPLLESKKPYSKEVVYGYCKNLLSVRWS